MNGSLDRCIDFSMDDGSIDEPMDSWIDVMLMEREINGEDERTIYQSIAQSSVAS